MSGKAGMNRRGVLGVSAGFGVLAAGAQAQVPLSVPLTQVDRTEGAIVFSGHEVCVRLVFSDSSLSVMRYGPDVPHNAGGFFAALCDASEIEAKPQGWQVRSGQWRVDVLRDTGTLSIFSNNIHLMTAQGGTLSRQDFQLAKTSDLYGLGQFRDPLVNYRDRSVYLAQANMDAVNPTLVSPNGWGLIWDTGTHAHISSNGAALSFATPDGNLIRYHVLAGEGVDGVISSYRRLTGRAPLLGKWAYGFWQSQERYRTQKELTDILDTYRTLKLPIDVMVQDWRYWGENNLFSGMVWDKATFPDPKGMCDHVHKQNAHVIASVWPAFGADSSVFKALDQEGLLFKGPHWSGGRVLDITSPRAQDIYWAHIKDGLMSVGLDGLWTDGCEPEFMSTGSRYVTTLSYLSNGQCFVGPIKDHLLTFSYYQTRKLHTEAKKAYPQKRPLILTRSTYAGQQAFNAVTWSGDIFAGWQTLKNQIVAAQQITLSGIPYWTMDIGAFLVTHRFEGGLKNAAYRELYVRWFQFAAFLPIFRAHGTEIRREVWAMQATDGGNDETAYQALVDALNLRYALMPYIYSQAARVTFNDETYIRPLVMDFASDPKIKAYPYQYMFAHDILVANVVTPLDQAQKDTYEFIPNWAVTGLGGPAPEVTFYEGANFEKLVETRHSDDLKMSWSGDIPAALADKPYSSRWKGKIIATESGPHSFSIITQGLIRFSLDGQVKVASIGASNGVATQADGAVSFKGHTGDDTYRFDMVLEKGRAYEFELTQSQPKPNVVSLWVEWLTPSNRAEMQISPDKTIEVYLPKNWDWYRFGSAKKLKGGQTLKLRPQLADQLLYVRAGAIIPQTPGIQYALQPVIVTELHVYGGRDGQFDLYDDAGDGHGYEAGEKAITPLIWKDGSRTLTIEAVKGEFPSMTSDRAFKVILYRDGQIIEKSFTIVAGKVAQLTF